VPAAPSPGGREYAFLQSLAADLSAGKISFPTFTGATLRVRSALADPNLDADRLSRVIMSEPLLSARLVKIANSVALNPTGRPVADVRNAVLRVGFDVVRSSAVALALEQLRAAKDVQVFHENAEWTWRHSLEVGTIAYVVARGIARVNPDEALFAGLVHDIGRFYLLARATAVPEVSDDFADLDRLIHEWHPSIGQAVLHEFQLPEPTLLAVAEHENHRPATPPRSVLDVVAIADRVALQLNPPRYPSAAPREYPPVTDPSVLQLVQSSTEDIRGLLAALRG